MMVQLAAKDFMWAVIKAYEEQNKLLPRLMDERGMIDEGFRMFGERCMK